MSEHPDDVDSPPQTPLGTTPTPTAPLSARPMSGRAASYQWSVPNTPHHHHQGTSYFPSSTPKSPSLARRASTSSTRRATRSDSVSSRGGYDSRVPEEEDEDADVDEEEDDEEELARRAKVRARRGKDVAPAEAAEDPEPDDDPDRDEDDPLTLKERQSLINVEHPFGLPIWKPALYKKSRSVTRYADEALHSVPSAQAERHLLPGNIFWTVIFGWWLALACFVVAGLLYIIPKGGRSYSSLVFGLGWYIAWPFGKYVEGEDDEEKEDEDDTPHANDEHLSHTTGNGSASEYSTGTIRPGAVHQHSVSWSPVVPNETAPLLAPPLLRAPSRAYGATPSLRQPSSFYKSQDTESDRLGKICFWVFLVCIIAPLILIVTLACWALVITIPMARLQWQLIKYLFTRPNRIRFCAAPPSIMISSTPAVNEMDERPEEDDTPQAPPTFSVKHPRLSAGQIAPSSPESKVLLCTYRAVGWQYYKYTVGGVNIMFVNLLPVVFLVILAGNLLMPEVTRREKNGEHVPAALGFFGSRVFIFVCSLLSVIPLSYFIGMAVASISAQSSIGMGAVINATFGSIIEIILYALALKEGKGHLVEGSIVGSLMAGVLLMPGLSMCGSAIRRKEQKFNSKSAGVTSMMLIMAIIGTLTPTLFYQIYGNFQLVCSGCPSGPPQNGAWVCDHCYYQHPDPVEDPFYQSTVKVLMYFCAAVLLLSYLIGLWFSLRTHATQIWQNPQQLMNPMELAAHRFPFANKLPGLKSGVNTQLGSGASTIRGLNRKASNITNASDIPSRAQTPVPPRVTIDPGRTSVPSGSNPNASPSILRRVSHANQPTAGLSPVAGSADEALKSSGIQTMPLPENMTTEDFTRAVAVATVSVLRQHNTGHSLGQSPARARVSGVSGGEEAGGHGGHEGPSWSRTTSASVLLACTALYAAIAELLVDVVDVILEGSGIDEKFLGITLFALVPNTTEFMNAISFAVNGNIALSMEIGSAYALQVCLLQIPAMVAFSAWYAPDRMGKVSDTFTLVFPRWDVIVIILAVFLMTYTWIEAKSNYHRGSILILSYLVLASGFYFAPHIETPSGDDQLVVRNTALPLAQSAHALFSSLWI